MPSGWGHFGLFVAGLALAGTVASSCADTGPVPTTGAVPEVPIPVDVRASLGTESERFALTRAEQALVLDCMTVRGFDYVVSQPAELATSNRWDRLEDVFRFGVAPDSSEDEFGAVSSLSTYQAASADPNDDALSEMSESEQAAWYAAYIGSSAETYSYVDPESGNSFETPVDGCLASARLELFGSFGSYVQLVSFPLQFAEVVYAEVEAKTSYASTIEAWQGCMNSRGSALMQPSEALGEVLIAISEGVESVGSIEKLERRNYSDARACAGESDVYTVGWSLVPGALTMTLETESARVDAYRTATQDAIAVLAAHD